MTAKLLACSFDNTHQSTHQLTVTVNVFVTVFQLGRLIKETIAVDTLDCQLRGKHFQCSESAEVEHSLRVTRRANSTCSLATTSSRLVDRLFSDFQVTTSATEAMCTWLVNDKWVKKLVWRHVAQFDDSEAQRFRCTNNLGGLTRRKLSTALQC